MTQKFAMHGSCGNQASSPMWQEADQCPTCMVPKIYTLQNDSASQEYLHAMMFVIFLDKSRNWRLLDCLACCFQ
mgnify:CR=1 FL=1